MIALPQQIASQFHTLLLNHSVPKNSYGYYKKWLRYYWDFCHKYRYDPFHKDNLPLFVKKLEDKRQSEQQRSQAQHAITIFYQINTTSIDSYSNTAVSSGPSLLNANKEGPAPSAQAINLPANKRPIYDDSTQSRVAEPTSYQNNNVIPHSSSIQTGTSWVFIFDTLKAEIKIRHYSPKTFKAYRWWISNFQAYT